MSDRVNVAVFVAGFEPGLRWGGPIRSVTRIVDTAPPELRVKVFTSDTDLGAAAPYHGLSGKTVVRGENFVTYIRARAPAHWRAVQRDLRLHPPQLVYFNSYWNPVFTVIPWVAMRLRLIPKAPILIAPRGEFTPGALSIKRRKKRFVDRIWHRIVGSTGDVTWHATSRTEAEQIDHRFPDERRIIVAEPLATDETPSHPEHAPSRVLRAVFVGRLSPMKNLDLVLEALALCTSSIEFDIYGPTESPEYWERCQSLLRALPTNIRARYRGVLLPNEVVEALTSYEIYIFPTKGENFGHSIAESLAAGCKVLCSDQTPWSELLEAGAGWVITDPNPRRLAECVDRFGGLTEDARYLERLRARELFESWRSAQPHTNVLAASLRLESSHD